MKTVVRRAGRVLPVHDDRVLLLRGGDPARPDAGQWWFTVGGGCEGDETAVDAARREAFEEAGLELGDDLGPVVLHRQTSFEFAGEWLEQTEDYFLCRVGTDEVVTSGWNELERRVLTAQRWWSVAELRATTDRVFPEGLADLLAGLGVGDT